MDTDALRARIAEHVQRHALIAQDEPVTCLVSGGADSTCLWHALGALGFERSAIHVNHGLRGDASDEDARFCAEVLGAEIVDRRGVGETEAELRELRYDVARDRLRATGHTASDQVETVLYRLVSSGVPGGIKVRREDGVVRPLLSVWREETVAYCRAENLPFREDASNSDTKRGLIREQILPLLRRLDERAEANLLALADERRRLPRQTEEALLQLLASREGSQRIDVGSGLQAVREYDSLWLERAPVELHGAVRWGDWVIQSELPGLHVRGWRPGDRLAGRKRKIQDVFVDAKVPRSHREAWPLVVRGDEVVAVPGIVDAAGISARRETA